MTANPSCDNTYFSWADTGDNNCMCVPPGTDCMSILEDHIEGVSTWILKNTCMLLLCLQARPKRCCCVSRPAPSG